MKKSLISLAVAAGLAASGAAIAGDSTVYGNVHLTINKIDVGNTDGEWNMSSHTSAIGVKGSEDLGDGMKALYKVEFQINPDERCNSDDTTLSIDDAGGNNDGVVDVAEVSTGSSGCDAITDRDQWVGLKGGMGTVKFGTMSSNYKQMGGKVDPLYRTPIEGRGFLATQSSTLHGGAGTNRGRTTNLVQYSSPKMGGIQVVANTTFSGTTGDETIGLGVRYDTKNLMAYADWIDSPITAGGADSEAAFKVGAKFSGDGFSIGGQFESAADRTASSQGAMNGNDYLFLAGTFSIDKNNLIAASYGQAMSDATNADTDGLALAYLHVLSKQTMVYLGYGSKGSDAGSAGEIDALALGIRKKF